MARGPLRDREEKKQEALRKIEYHRNCIEKLEQLVDELSKPKVSHSKQYKKQAILQDKINSGLMTIEEAEMLGYNKK